MTPSHISDYSSKDGIHSISNRLSDGFTDYYSTVGAQSHLFEQFHEKQMYFYSGYFPKSNSFLLYLFTSKIKKFSFLFLAVLYFPKIISIT